MEKFPEIVRWIAVGAVGLFMVVLVLTRGFLLISFFVHSPLPWWILTPAAIALVAGFVYLFKRNVRRTRVGPK
jgi:membrane protein YdbS with pleckstrin-like domain